MGICIVTPSLEVWLTKDKEVPDPLNTKPNFKCFGEHVTPPNHECLFGGIEEL